ncbi:bifunctional riboflavin kinase/FAD synthetase [Candidatus Ruminimicrobium bovinum]|uniref:bifunctional riboflavin kinase/FAD synthetase n=1 Tax=Candidatus Ruminimicrobium bovinum TaxID=3242779 RepID=UPI0039B8428A
MIKAVVTLGTFDGFHIGHSAVIKKTIEISEKYNLKSIVIVIEKPLKKIEGLITLPEEKLQILSSYPIDEILLIQPNKSLANMSADDFLKNVICKQLNAQHLVVGYDSCFGKQRQGNIKWLKKNIKKYDIDLTVIKPVKVSGKIVSSTKIRNLILNNKIEQANLMLGRSFEITGEHVSGNRIGRTINFPTVNVAVDENKILPKGVFVCSLIDKNKIFKGVLNIGTNPTIKKIKHKLSLEVHLLDFNKNKKFKTVKILVHKFLRKEKKFKNLDELKKQITKDIKICKANF